MTIEKSVLVPLDADETFALLTEPERLRRWQAVARRGSTSGPAVSSAGPSYPGANAGGTFVEVEPGKRLVYTWGWEGDEGLPPGHLDRHHHARAGGGWDNRAPRPRGPDARARRAPP